MGNILELAETKQIFRVLNPDTKKYNLYVNDLRFFVSVSPEFQAMWANIKIPDDIDLERAMKDAGLRMGAQQKSKKRPAQKTKRKQGNRKIKLTNNHLSTSQIDLSKDYVPPPLASKN